MNFLRDVKFGLKLLRKDRSFTVTAILTLAICMGGNTAIFTIVNSVLLRPLPVPESERILLMSNQYPNAGVGRSNNSGVPDYYDRLAGMNVYQEQAMFSNTGQTIEIGGVQQRVRGMTATPSLFRLLRVPPLIGRSFTDEEGEAANAQKVILSYGLWQELYGGDANVIGRELRLSGRPFTIVGVMPRDFLFLQVQSRFWIPLTFTAEQKSDDNRHSNNWIHIGRLKPGATMQQAQAQVDAINAANLERFPKFREILLNAGFRTTVEPLQEMLVHDVRSTLYLLWGGAAFVLLIGAVNIANLVLARSSLRGREVATRLALGASRISVTRQLLTESIIVTLIGGVAGLVFALALLRGLAAVGLAEIPRATEIRMDSSVVGYVLVVSLGTGILIGLVPLARLVQVNLNNALRSEGRSGTGGRAVRAMRSALVIAQVGFAFVLLVGAGLLLSSFRHLLMVDPGFKAAGVVTASMNAPGAKYPDAAALRDLMARMLASIRAIPGVVAAGATTTIPFGGNYSDSVILAEGYEMQPGESLVSPRQVTVTPGYFEAMSIGLVRGRLFDDHDTESAPAAVVVDEKLARKFWPNQDPIGRRMYRPDGPDELLKPVESTRWLHVVGVVKEVHLENLENNVNQVGTYYFPSGQNPPRGAVLAIRTSADPAAVTRAVRAEVSKIDADLALFDVQTMEERTATALLPRRAAMLLARAFGVVALFLSAIGIYGVLAYLVSQRAREIGIRIALGSTSGGIFQLILREGVLLTTGGIAAGIAGTLALRGAIEGQVYGIQPMDPVVIGVVAVAMSAIALFACTVPAHRATRVDPVTILNET
jgi:predicted permease